MTWKDGALRPRRIRPNENLARNVPQRGGRVWSSWDRTKASMGLSPTVLVDGNASTHFDVLISEVPTLPEYPAEGTIYVDLGGIFGVNRVRILLPPEWEWEEWGWGSLRKTDVFQELRIARNDGNPESVDGRGQPILTSVWRGRHRSLSDLEVPFSTAPTRYVGVSIDGSGLGIMEIGEVEVYGEGYVPKGLWVSPVIDLDVRSALGDLRWIGHREGKAKVLVRTRAGTDDDPNVYWRVTEDGERTMFSEETGEPLTREDYNRLGLAHKGGTTHDRAHWSFWSAPYSFEEGMQGTPMVSPSPRQYVQFKIEFKNPFSEAGAIDSLALEFSHPPVARRLVSEVWPVDVPPATVTTFTYALQAYIEDDDTGFDTVEIRTLVRPERVRSVRIHLVEVPFEAEILDDPAGLLLHVPLVTIDRSVVEVTFDCAVVRYGSAFLARVFRSDLDQVPQLAAPGNAKDELPGNDVSVRISLKSPLIGSLSAFPNPFTPNGDRIHDETTISYALLHLSAPAPVCLTIHDLSGGMVRRLYDGRDENGLYGRVWDGRDEEGRLVLPGVYLYDLSVRSDAGEAKRAGTVTVCY